MKRKLYLPILLVLLIAACARNADELSEQVTASTNDYDSVAAYVTNEIVVLMSLSDSGATLTDEQKQRAIALGELLAMLDTYKSLIDQMEIDPDMATLQSAVDTWTDIKERATALGWEAIQ